MRIQPNETEIRGAWAVVKGRVEADSNCRRINELISHHLREVASDASGWDSLYVDPSDNRFWELTYPESASHGGGPPHLRHLLRSEVRKKFGDDAFTK